MLSILLLQLFWASFAIIGLSAVVAASKHIASNRLLKVDNSLALLRTAHPVIAVLTCWIIGILLFSPIIVLSYFFEWSAMVLAVFYVAALIAAAYVTFASRKKILAKLARSSALTSRQALVLILVGASVLADYIISMKIGAPLYSDAPVQLAKIHLFVASHFTLSDPYYRYNGVVDPRYSVNLMNAYQALAGKLLHTSAIRIWSYSYAFYRLIIWISLFALSWFLLPRKYRVWSYLVLAAIPVTLGVVFVYADLPDRIVFAWICLFVIGLKLWFEKRAPSLLIAASLLIATTHALFSLMALGYLCFLMAAMFVLKSLKPKESWPLLISVGILFVPVALNLYYPNHTNQDAGSYNPGLAPPPLHAYGPLHITISQLPAANIFTLLAYLFVLGCLLLTGKTSYNLVKPIVYALAAFFLLLWFNYEYLALIGYGLLFWSVESKKLRIVIGCLLLYYPLMIYNPLFWRLNHGAIPPWVIFRFSYFNIIGLIVPLVGLFAYTLLPFVVWRCRAWSGYIGVSVSALVIGLAVYNGSFPGLYPWWPSVSQLNTAREQTLRPLEAVSSALKNQIVYSNDPDLPMLLPEIVSTGVVNFQPANESPMANIARRDQCAKLLAANMTYADLKASKATVILTDPNHSAAVDKLARNTDFLHLVTSYQGYEVYGIYRNKEVPEMPGVCSIPYGG